MNAGSQRLSEGLSERLREVPDLSVRQGAALAPLTTFRVGGPAEWLVDVPTLRGLRGLLSVVRSSGVPFCLLGTGSNVLVPAEGLVGVVARLGGTFRRWRVRGRYVSAGGALALATLARKTCERDLIGLEALAGFPSTVGGAVYMNAGCYGTEIKDVLVRATVLEDDGVVRRLGVEDLGAGYRRTCLQGSGRIVTRAVFALEAGDGRAALRRMQELNRRRWSSLPSGVPNAGSIFRNPDGEFAGRLIEAAGLKGRQRGDAQISDRHANVIVNLGAARAADVMALMADAYRAVASRFGIALEPEIVLAGELRDRWTQITDGVGVM